MSEENERNARKYLSYVFGAIFTIAIVKWLWPGIIPFGLFAVWRTSGSALDWLAAGWPVLAWGFCVQSLILLFSWARRFMRDPFEAASPRDILKAGFFISLWAGVMEEISFRWLIFYAQIFWLKVADFLFYSVLGFGLFSFFHLHVFAPIADYTTFGGLHDWLFSPAGWAVGAAMLATNAIFRDGHTYQGWFGVLNSWFCGMFLFWLMFCYGLPAAILIHFLYDMIIFGTIAGFSAIQSRRATRVAQR
jgi:hypothetical protein